MEWGLPTPPWEDHHHQSSHRSRRSQSSIKSSNVRHGARRARTGLHPPSLNHKSPSMADGRHKRVWKACERCRMKKTKVLARPGLARCLHHHSLTLAQCDDEFPCKRCRDDGLVCTAGTRKKMEYKQLPKGYVTACRLPSSFTPYMIMNTRTRSLTAKPKSSRTPSSPSSPPNTSSTPWSARVSTGSGASRSSTTADSP